MSQDSGQPVALRPELWGEVKGKSCVAPDFEEATSTITVPARGGPEGVFVRATTLVTLPTILLHFKGEGTAAEVHEAWLQAPIVLSRATYRGAPGQKSK